VIFRKVTNCFRAEWGAKVYGAAASVIATGRLHGLTALEALRAALTGVPVMRSG
jgi:transposase